MDDRAQKRERERSPIGHQKSISTRFYAYGDELPLLRCRLEDAGKAKADTERSKNSCTEIPEGSTLRSSAGK
jgi:hypothetical protein